jgi:hypothetical protein
VAAMEYVSLGTNWVNVIAFVNANATVTDVLGAPAAATANTTSLVTADITNTTQLAATLMYLSAA